MRYQFWKAEWCHSNAMECNTQVQTLKCRYTSHCHSQSISNPLKTNFRETDKTLRSTALKPCKTITVHCNYSEYTPTIFRTIQALVVDNYIYSLQLVTGNMRRAVSSTGLPNQEGVQKAQNAKPSRLEHLPAGLGGGLQGHSTPLPEKFLLYTTGT